MTGTSFDVLVVGAGAAGMMAAIEAGRRGQIGRASCRERV